MKSRLRSLIGLVALAAASCWAQTPERPLPDIPTLMHQVEDHQKASETLVKDYLYHSLTILQSVDGHGVVKETKAEDADVFYVAGIRIERLTRKNGKDLTPEEQKKESQRIDKEITKAKEKQGKAEDDRDIVTVSRFLELGSFGNAHRITLNGRDTIVIDFTGNPKAKIRNRMEAMIREIEGTIWIDEQDRALVKLQGHFVNPFKIGAGMLADVKQGFRFEAEWTKINGEVWLPASVNGEGSIRFLLLLNFHGSLRVTNSNYRKFKATATILPITNTDITQPQPQQPQ